MTARCEVRAKHDHDRLIDMGGRPTRPVRLQPIWNATYKHGLIYISDKEGNLECTLSEDIDPMNHHWSRESKQFREELQKWQQFREYQQSVQHLDRLETDLELDNTDAGLIEMLTRLSDWQQFETFQDLTRVDAAEFESRCRLSFLQITKWENTCEYSPTRSVGHEAIRTWLRQFDYSQEDMEAAKNQLNWVKGEWPKLVAEVVDSMAKTPELLPKLEAKLRKQTHAVFNEIQKLGGRPSHAFSPPDESIDDLQRLLHWSLETSKYTEELLEWKTFLEWRQYHLGQKSTVQRQEYQCPHYQSAIEFLAEFEKFRLFQYNIALTWLKCWQRIVRWHEEEIENPDPDVPDITPGYLDDYAEAARSRVRDMEQRLAEAAAELEQSTQERVKAVSEHSQPTGGETGIGCPQQSSSPTLPLSVSESSQSSRSSSTRSPPQSSLSISSPPSSRSSITSSPPQSPLSSPSPPSSRSSQSPQSPGRLTKDRRSSSKGSPAEKIIRRAKKKNAKKAEGKTKITNTEQQALPEFSFGPHQVERDDDIQMADAPEDPRSIETTDMERAEAEDTIMSDVEDTLNHNTSSLLESQSETIITTDLERAQSPIARRTRSATKPKQALSGRVTKNMNKKPAKKPKQFTEQQTTMLLNAASANDSAPPRRSERLRQKAAAAAAISPSHLHTVQSSQTSGRKQHQKESGPVESFRSSRQKKSKVQPNALDENRKPRQKKPRAR